jgi:hypothetical protein
MVAIALWAHPIPRRSKLYRSVTDFGYAHGNHLAVKTTPSPDVVDDDDEHRIRG